MGGGGVGRGSVKPKMGVPTYFLANFFPENCMKIKEIGPGGHQRRAYALEPPMVILLFVKGKYACVHRNNM